MSQRQDSEETKHALVVARPVSRRRVQEPRSNLPAVQSRQNPSVKTVEARPIARQLPRTPTDSPFADDIPASRLARSTVSWNTELKESSTTLELSRRPGARGEPAATRMHWAREALKRQTEHKRRQVRGGKPVETNNSRETNSYDERCTVTEDDTPTKSPPPAIPGSRSAAIALSDKPTSALAQLRARRSGGISLSQEPAIQPGDGKGSNKKTRTIRYTRTHHKTSGPKGNSWTVVEKYQAKEKTSRFKRMQDEASGESGVRLVEDEKEYTSHKTWLVEPDTPPRLLSKRREVKSLTGDN